jgi:hypothetical protein
MSDFAIRLDAVFETMDQLTELLEAENQVLAAHRPQEIVLTVDRKLMLTRTFDRQVQQLGDFASCIAALPAPARQQAAARAERFRRAARNNQTALDAARRAAERVVGHIVDAVRKQNAPAPIRYGRPTQVPSRSAAGRLSVSLDQVF